MNGPTQCFSGMKLNVKTKRFLVTPGSRVKLKNFSTDDSEPFNDKEEAEGKLRDDVKILGEWQTKLYAQDSQAVLVILQGMDASGKDGTIKHVASGLNPMGCEVSSFKAPSEEELDHDYLWRYGMRMPGRGKIGIFNRSHYEEVLIVRVHPELLERQKLPEVIKPGDIWKQRYEQINAFESYLVDNGVTILKIFLHLSKKEQKKRFLERIENPEKHWKFSPADVEEREYWDQYQLAYEQMLTHTSTDKAPWYVVPADRKWFTHAAVAELLIKKISSLDIDFPKIKGKKLADLEKARKLLAREN